MAGVSMDSLRAPWDPVHPAEIASRDFPRARKGFDPEAVRAWLRTVAASVESLERELNHVRAERDRLESALRRAGEEPVASTVRAALLEARLRRRSRGYDRAEVETLLEAAAAEIARLETRAAVLEADAANSRQADARADSLFDTIARLESELAAIRRQVTTTSVNGNGSGGTR